MKLRIVGPNNLYVIPVLRPITISPAPHIVEHYPCNIPCKAMNRPLPPLMTQDVLNTRETHNYNRKEEKT